MTPQVTLRLSANASGLTAALQGVQQRLGATAAAADAAGRSGSRGLGQVETSGRRASDALTDLVANAKAFAASFAGLAGAGALARVADEYTNLSSKIRLVTSSEQELKAVREAVFQVAQQTRQDLSATAELYTRLARSTADMGLSQQKLLGITTTINQAFVVSGATAAEASASIIQLSQGLASGVLRGEEFNSVAEQAPIIMDLLAKELNVTRGELRKMAEDGKLTADVLVNALGNGAAGVAEQFGKMQLTIGQATTQLQNSFTAFIGQADEANGASRAFAESISWLAENLPTIANAVFRFGLALAALYGAQMLARAVAFTVQLGLQAAAHATSTALLIRQQGVMATLFATQALGFAASLKSIGAITAASGALAAGFAGWQIGSWLREEFLEVELFGIAMVEGLLVAWERMKTGAKIAWEGIKAAAVGYFNIAREGVADLLVAMANVAQSAAESGGKVAEFFGVSDGTANRMRELAASIRPTTSAWDSFKAAAAAAVIEGEKNIAAIRQTTGEMADYAIQSRQATVETVGLADAASGASTSAKTMATDLEDAAEAMDKLREASKDAREGLAGLLDQQAADLGGPAVRAAQRYRDTLVDIAAKEEAIRKAGELSAVVQAQLAQARAQAAQGYQKDLADIAADQNELVNRSRETVSEYQQIWDRGLDNIAFALGDFVSGSIRSFSDLGRELVRTAQRMLADIVGTFLRQRIVIPIQMAMAGNGGGLAGAAGQLAGVGGGGLGSILSALSPGALFGNAAFGAGTSLFGLGGSIGAFGGGLASAGANMLGSGFFGSMGANLSGAFASFGGGSLAAGLGQLLPVVGQIAAIAGLVNSLSGGKLFGTGWKAEGGFRDLSIGAGGAGGFDATVQTRQRSLFRGRQWREQRSDLPDDVQNAIDELFGAVGSGMQAAARALGVDVPDMIAGSFRQEFDKAGKLKREFSTIAGRVYEESQEAFGQRLLAENILATVGTRNGDASAIAERWRADAATLLDGSQFLLAAATDLRNGTALLTSGGLEAVTALVEDLATESESLTDAYTRVRAATVLLEDALAMSGLTLDRSREDFVRFAADIAEAAGGLDRAQSLWSTYFGTFFSASERAEQALARARSGAASQFADIGLDAAAFAGEGGVVAFRQMFERVLPTLSADAVVEWLEAAEAISGVLAAQQAYNDTLAESARQAEAAAAELRAAFEQLVAAIAQTRSRIADDIQGLRAAAPGFDAAAFQRGRIADLRGQLAGATPAQQVALIDQIRQATLARFEAESEQLRRVAEQQAQAAQAEAQRRDEAMRAAEQAHAEAMRGWEAQIEAARRLRDFVDTLGLSNVSPLTAFQRFDEAQALYQRALAGGDAGALQQAAQAFLEETRNVYGVSDRAVGIFNEVRGALGARADQLASAAAPVFRAPALEAAVGGTSAAVLDVEAAIEALRAQAIADLEGLDGLLVGLRDAAEAQFQTELEALQAQYEQADVNTTLVVDSIGVLNTDQAVRDAEALAVMREQVAATQALVERAEAQEAVTLRLLEQQEARLTEALGVVRSETERVARAVEQGLRAGERR